MFAPNRKTTCAKIRVHPQILILSCIAASFSSSISIYFPLPATIFGRSSEAPRVFSLQALQDYLGSRCLVGMIQDLRGFFPQKKNWLFISGLEDHEHSLSISLSLSLARSLSLSLSPSPSRRVQRSASGDVKKTTTGIGTSNWCLLLLITKKLFVEVLILIL